MILTINIEQDDENDLAKAWDRTMNAANDQDIIILPPGDYTTSKSLIISKQVSLIAYGAKVKSKNFTGVIVKARSKIFGIEMLGGGSTNLDHFGIDIQSRCYLVSCTARNFGADGFRILGDVELTPPTSASLSILIACESTGNNGRGFSLKGGDANACLILACSTSNCGGNYSSRKDNEPLIAGYHDDSFLGSYIVACHSGIHKDSTIGYCANKSSARSLIIGCYQEMSHDLLVGGQNVIAWCVGNVSPNSTGVVFRGNSIVGKFVLNGFGESKPTLTFSPNKINGVLAQLSSALDKFSYTIERSTVGKRNGWWVLRRANSSTQDILAWQADDSPPGSTAPVKPAQIWVPLGVLIGQSQKLLNDEWMNQIEQKISALEGKIK